MTTTAAELSSAQRGSRIRPRQRVYVRTLRGREFVWVGAWVKNTNRGGAMCKTDHGKEQFFAWGEITDPPPDDVPPPAPFVTLGELVATKKPELLPPPAPAHDQQPTAAASERSSEEEPTSRLIRLDRKRLHQEEATTTTTMKKPIGVLLREYRKRTGATQSELGKKLGLSLSQVSVLELGKTHVPEQRLNVLAKLLNISVDALKAAQSIPYPERAIKPRRSRREAAKKTTMTTTTRTKTRRKPPKRSATEQSSPATRTKLSAASQEFEFIMSLSAVVPIPTGDGGKAARAQWFDLAQQFFALRTR